VVPKEGYLNPPRFSEWLLKRLFPDRGDYVLVGDLYESFQLLAKERGMAHARLWYRLQMLKAIPAFLEDFLYWRAVMFHNYFKLAFRHMKRQKAFSFINIVGLAIGICCTLLILFWVRDELSYDKFHEHRQDLFRVICIGAEDSYFGSPAPFAPAIVAEIPEVVDAVRVRKASRYVFKYKDAVFYENNGISADPSFFEMFSFPLVKGDVKKTFSDPMTIALTESMAYKYFGDQDPLEKMIQVEGQAELKVVAVVADVPSNSHIQFDYVIPQKLVEVAGMCGLNWGDFNFRTYLKAVPQRDEQALIRKLNEVSEQHGCPQIVSKQLTFSVQPMSEIYLNPLGNYDIPLGDKRYVYLFSLIAVFILSIACINFINLSTARSERRAREVGLRKVVGANRMQVVRQFFGESVALAFLSLGLAIGLANLLTPVFNGLTGKNMAFELLSLDVLISLAAITCLVGFMAGLYPALYLASFEPINVLRSNLGWKVLLKKQSSRFIRKGILRRILVVTQFALSIILILATTVVYHQLSYMRNQSWSMKDDIILHVPAKDKIPSQYDVFKTELLRHPQITSVTIKDVVPTSLRNNTGSVDWEGKNPDQDNINMETTRIGYDYFKTMGMEIVAGRGFSPDFPGDVGSGFVLNEEAIKITGLEDPVGKMFRLYGMRGTIVGVVKNTHFHSLRVALMPQVFYPFTDLSNQSFGGVILIRISNLDSSAALSNTVSFIEGVWNDMNSFAPFEYHFLDETIDALYQNEQRLGRLFSYFAFLAVFISCLGLFGLVSFVAEQRTKEIGIRKAMGASIKDIMLLLSKDFTRWVLLSNLIAWPLGWYAMSLWLQNFAYRTSVAWWSFLAAGAVALVIAWLTISLQTVKSARANPVDSLRYE
jgi:ABC-type antimicrobial peptide transport system permease subunit